MKTVYHIDQALQYKLAELDRLIKKENIIMQALIIEDLFARFRVVAWENKYSSEQAKAIALAESGSAFWVVINWLKSDAGEKPLDMFAFDQAWKEGK